MTISKFLSARGLGGVYALATAKARFYLAPTVYPCTNKFIFDILCECFLEGVRGNLFREKGSPAILLKITFSVPQAHGGGASFPSYGVRY